MLKKFDFFGVNPQNYSEEDDKAMKTQLGGFISIIIYIVGALYFLYLFIIWNLNQISPTITYDNKQFSNSFSYKFYYNPMSYGVISGNASLYNPQIIEYFPFRNINFQDLTILNQNTELQKCNQNLENNLGISNQSFYCLDPYNNNFTLEYNPDSSKLNQYMIIMTKCGSMFSQRNDCLPAQDYNNLFNLPQTQIISRFYVTQYDTQANNFKKVPIDNTFHIDDNQFLYVFVKFKISNLIIDDGWLLKNEKSYQIISDVSIQTTTVTDQYRKQVYGDYNKMYMLSYLMSIDKDYTEIRVQRAKLSQILAEFSGVFNIILLLAFISSKTSEIRFIDRFINSALNNYYKITAYDVKEQQNNNPIQNSQNSNLRQIVPQNEDKNQSENEINQSQEEHVINNTLQQGDTLNLHDIDLLNIYYQEKEVSDINDQALDNIQLFKLMQNKVKKQLNFFSLYQELYQLKTAVQLLLTHEQYAALKFVGRKVKNRENNLQQKTNEELNHIEEQEKIDEDQQFLKLNFHQYLKNVKEKKNQDDLINQNIYNSLLPQIKLLLQQNQKEVIKQSQSVSITYLE